MNAPQNIGLDQLETAATWSSEAEQSAIGSVLCDNRAFDLLHLDTEQFFDGRHRVIWSAIQTLIVACKPADVVTVFELIERRGQTDSCGGLAYINALSQSVVSIRHAGRYGEIVRDKAALRELRAKLFDGLSITAGDGDTATKIAEVVGSLSELQRLSVKSVPRPVGDIVPRCLDRYQDLGNGDAQTSLSTGIPKLDNLLGGGLKPGKVYLLAARPSVGKSSLSEQIALGVSMDGAPALFLSQEMPSEELTDRAISNIGRVRYSATQTGDFSDKEWGDVSKAVEVLSQLPLHIDDQASLTVADIRLKAQIVPGLKLLVLDYLQLCASTRKDGNRNSEIEEISRGLKTLAKELNIPILALSQLNRSVEQRAGGEPLLSDLRDSGSLEQDADVVMFLWTVKAHEHYSLVGCKVDKNRGGKKGRFALHFAGDTQHWAESTADIDFKPMSSRGKHAEGFDD